MYHSCNDSEKKSDQVLYDLISGFLVDNAATIAAGGFTPPQILNVDETLLYYGVDN